MATKVVEGQLPYTGGTAINIDGNKVISVLLREENNLILVNDDNELYTDLQLADGIKPSDDFPVGVTVGKILASDGWTRNGLLLNRKTTSGDYARWIYGADGEIYFDGGNGTRKQVYYSDEVDALFTQLRGELATVAFTGDYNDLINRPAFLQEQADWEQTDTDAPDYIKNKPTIPTVNDATLTIQKNGIGLGSFTANSNTNTTVNIPVPGVIDNVSSTSTTDALSANQGKELQDQIDNLTSMGRFLSLWNSATGLPISFPLDIPYNYKTGDYFLVETIGATNYRPDGVQYTGAASTTVETDEVEIGDMYIYDGQVWLLQINHGKTVSFANLSGQPSDNANLATALNAKANSADLATVATSGSYNDLTDKPTIPSGQIQSDWGQTNTSAVDYIKNKPTVPTNTSQLNNDSGFITSAYHDSSKQDVLSAGTGISISSNTVTNTGVTSVNGQAGDVTVNEVPSSGTTGYVLTKTANGYDFQAPAAGGITNDTTGTTTTVSKIWAGTEDEYTALQNKQEGTIYGVYSETGRGPVPSSLGDWVAYCKTQGTARTVNITSNDTSWHTITAQGPGIILYLVGNTSTYNTGQIKINDVVVTVYDHVASGYYYSAAISFNKGDTISVYTANGSSSNTLTLVTNQRY